MDLNISGLSELESKEQENINGGSIFLTIALIGVAWGIFDSIKGRKKAQV